MTVEDITVQILRQIRDEIITTRDHLGGRIDQTNQRIDSMRADLGGRIDETNSRLDETNLRVGKVEHALLDLAEQQRFVVRHLQALTTRDHRLEDEVGDLRTRVEAIEKKVGAP